MKTRRVGVINDLHIPYHDEKAVNAVLAALQDAEITELVLNGDVLDFYNLNMHDRNKHPDIVHTLEDELDAGLEFIKKLRSMFSCKIMFVYGNHEFRLERYIIDKVPSFHNLLRLEYQLQFKRYNIDFIEYNQKYHLLPDLYVQHSPPSYSKNGAMVSLENKLDCSAIYGCTHRVQHAARTGSSGKVYNVWFNGWLGSTTASKEHSRVFSYAKGHQNWQQAGCLIDIIGDYYSVNQFQVIDGRCVVDGFMYQG